MRFLAILLIAMILLVGCAGNKVYNYKGIYYPEKEAKELDALIKFDIPSEANSKLTTHIPGELLITEEMLYYPVETSYRTDSLSIQFTTVYAIDKSTNSIVDTLVLSNDYIRQDYRHLVWNKDLLIIGKNDSLCHIIKSDKDLNIIEDYPTGIRVSQIYYAGMNDDKLRLVVTDEMNNLVMYEFDVAGMSLERKRLLLKNPLNLKFAMDNSRLWFFQADASKVKTTRIDMSTMDPNPVFKDFDHSVQDAEVIKNYQVRVAGDILYYYYKETVADEKKPQLTKLVNIITVADYNTDFPVNEIINAPEAFDVVNIDGKTYYYDVSFLNARNIHTISETTNDLKNHNQLVSFLPAEYKFISYRGMDSVPQIYADGNKIYTTGYYFQNMDLSNKSKKVTVDWQPQLFLAIYSLE